MIEKWREARDWARGRIERRIPVHPLLEYLVYADTPEKEAIAVRALEDDSREFSRQAAAVAPWMALQAKDQAA